MKARQKKIVENYIKAYNTFDLEAMCEHLTDGLVFENVSNGIVDLRTEGLNAFKEQVATAKQYFSQRTQSIETWEFKNAKVTVAIAYTATLAMDFPNGLKTGDILELKGQSEFEFEQEKIKSIRDKS